MPPNSGGSCTLMHSWMLRSRRGRRGQALRCRSAAAHRSAPQLRFPEAGAAACARKRARVSTRWQTFHPPPRRTDPARAGATSASSQGQASRTAANALCDLARSHAAAQQAIQLGAEGDDVAAALLGVQQVQRRGGCCGAVSRGARVRPRSDTNRPRLAPAKRNESRAREGLQRRGAKREALTRAGGWREGQRARAWQRGGLRDESAAALAQHAECLLVRQLSLCGGAQRGGVDASARVSSAAGLSAPQPRARARLARGRRARCSPSPRACQSPQPQASASSEKGAAQQKRRVSSCAALDDDETRAHRAHARRHRQRADGDAKAAGRGAGHRRKNVRSQCSESQLGTCGRTEGGAAHAACWRACARANNRLGRGGGGVSESEQTETPPRTNHRLLSWLLEWTRCARPSFSFFVLRAALARHVHVILARQLGAALGHERLQLPRRLQLRVLGHQVLLLGHGCA